MEKKIFHPLLFIVFVFSFIFLILGYRYFDKYQARSFLVESMKDPTSVIFRKEEKKGEFLCGEVNSKNGFGAYTGFERFIANNEGLLLENGVLIQNLKEKGYSLFNSELIYATDEKQVNSESDLKQNFNLVWSKVCERN